MKLSILIFSCVLFITLSFVPSTTKASTPTQLTQKQHHIELLQQLIVLLKLQKEFLLQQTPSSTATTSSTSFSILRAEGAEKSSYIEVYFDKPVYKDDNSICYLSTTIESLKSLCELDTKHIEIVNGVGIVQIPIDGVFYSDPSDLSHVTVVANISATKKSVPLFIRTLNNGTDASNEKFFPIKIYPFDKTRLKIETISLRVKDVKTFTAQTGDTIEVYVKTNKPLWGMGFSAQVSDSVSEFGHGLKVSKIGDTEYLATFLVTSDFHTGPLSFEFYNFADLWSTGTKSQNPITKSTDGTSISIVK